MAVEQRDLFSFCEELAAIQEYLDESSSHFRQYSEDGSVEASTPDNYCLMGCSFEVWSPHYRLLGGKCTEQYKFMQQV